MADSPESLALQGLSYYNGAEFISDLSPLSALGSVCSLIQPRRDMFGITHDLPGQKTPA
jgi:hypothetical protein